MTAQNRRALKGLKANIRNNTPRIEKRLSHKSVTKPDPALVFSAAKYYKALNKLAKDGRTRPVSPD